MTDVLSNYAGNQALTDLLNGVLYLALHETDPTVTARLDTEVAGGGYVRQPITFATASGRTRVSNKQQTFPGMPAVTVHYLAVWTQISGGYMIFTKALAPGIVVPESGQLLAAAGDVAITL